MGLTAAKPLAALSPKQVDQIAKDNSTAQSALSKRFLALDDTIHTADDKLAKDAGLGAYPDARQRLERVKTAAEDGKSVIGQEQAIRERLSDAAQSGDQAGVHQAQADLATLKKNNPKIFGKASTSSPTIECPAISSATCDTAISNVNYLGTTGPSSPLSPDHPCYGTSLAEWDGWDEMIAHGCATAEERDIITAMSANEGSFEAVQSYDSMALTFGAMQKTVNVTGASSVSSLPPSRKRTPRPTSGCLPTTAGQSKTTRPTTGMPPAQNAPAALCRLISDRPATPIRLKHSVRCAQQGGILPSASSRSAISSPVWRRPRTEK